ncbi:MAG: thiol-disulfide oxidoreductase DCC family protein [Pleurocapsa sp.]
MTSVSEKSNRNSSAKPAWKIKLLYDGQCPLCVREVNFLTKQDAGRGIVKFVDIASTDYDPQDNEGIDFATAMGRIHAILPNGKIIKNVEVFQQVYEQLGMGWVYAITKVPLIGASANWLYGLWADWRLKLTGRPNIDTIITERQKKLSGSNSKRCRVN